MFFELIAAVTAGIAGGGVVMLINLATRGLLPRWCVPAAAGLSMIGFGIYMEYSWYERSTGKFPEGVEVAQTHQSGAFWRPWTYVWPITDRFVAVDLVSIMTNDAVPEQRRANLLFFDRWQAPRVVPTVFDCSKPAMAPMLDSVTLDENGAVTDAPWGALDADDPSLKIVCKEV